MNSELRLFRLQSAVYANVLARKVFKHLNGGMLCVPNLKVLDRLVRQFFQMAPSRDKVRDLMISVLNGDSIGFQNISSILSKASRKRLTAPMDVDKMACSCGYHAPKARQLLAAEMVVILAHNGYYCDIDAYKKPLGQDHASLIRKRWKILPMEQAIFDLNPIDYEEDNLDEELERMFERREDSMGVD